MNRLLKIILITVLAAGLTGLTAAGIAYAQTDDPPDRESLADLLGLTRDQLRDQLRSGASLEELAQEAGIDLETYFQERQLARQQDFASRIEEALENGKISQDHADWLLEGLEKGFLGRNGLMDWFPQRGTRNTEDGFFPFGSGQHPGRGFRPES